MAWYKGNTDINYNTHIHKSYKEAPPYEPPKPKPKIEYRTELQGGMKALQVFKALMGYTIHSMSVTYSAMVIKYTDPFGSKDTLVVPEVKLVKVPI